MAGETTMRVVDPSFIEDDSSENSDLFPIDVQPIDDEFNDTEEFTIQQVSPDKLEEETQESVLGKEVDIIKSLLFSKGIDDPEAIKFEEEDGTIVDKSFYDLTPEEQLEILNSNDADINYGLEDHEVEVISLLRENNMTFDELVEFYKNQAVEEYKNSVESSSFEIDSYTDEELYVLDMKTKFEDLTEDELRFELEKALENPDLFKKKADKIRNEYKQLETQEKELATSEQQAQRDQIFKEVEESLTQVASSLEDIGGLILEDQDKEEVIKMITERDLNGSNSLVKALDIPENLFKAAWFIAKGDEAFNTLHNYYKKEIENVRKTAYQKGKEDSIKGMPSKPISIISKPSFVTKNKPSETRYRSIDDLHSID